MSKKQSLDLKLAQIYPYQLGTFSDSIKALKDANATPLEISQVITAIGLLGNDEVQKRKLNLGGWVPQEVLYTKEKKDAIMMHFLNNNYSFVFSNPEQAYKNLQDKRWHIITDPNTVSKKKRSKSLLHVLFDDIDFDEDNKIIYFDPDKPAGENTVKGKIQRNYYGKDEETFKDNCKTLITYYDTKRKIILSSKDEIYKGFKEYPEAIGISKACWLRGVVGNSDVNAGAHLGGDLGLVFGIAQHKQ